MSSKPPHYFVISSPSGGGKTTLIQKLLADRPTLHLSVSYTTRPPREGEIEGRDYHFISETEFLQKIERHELLEWEKVHNFLYGTPNAAVQGVAGDVLFDVDTKGAQHIRQIYPHTTLIFIQPPSLEVLRQRLEARGTENAGELRKRLNRFQDEMAEKDKFDYVIINDEVKKAVQKLKEIIVREGHRGP